MKGWENIIVNIPIRQESLGRLVANKLRKSIWEEELAFGERLVETELSARFSVSRSTIRDALKILEHEELVISKPRKGTYVANFTKEDWQEMLELRILIEAYAFVKALDYLTDKHFRDLKQIVQEMEKYLSKPDWSKLFDLDMKFHHYVITLSNNSRIIKIYESLQIQIRAIIRDLETYYPRPELFYEEQLDLLNVLQTKDPQAVDKKIRTHLGAVQDHLLSDK